MEFIEKYAKVNGSDEKEMSVSGGDEVINYSDEEFIDDKESVQGQDPSDYRLMNVTRDLQDALANHSMAEELNLICSDLENFVVPDCTVGTEREYDKFKNFEKRIKTFKDLKIFMLDSKDSFFMQILMDFITQSLKTRKSLIFVKTSKN